jgi:hypothetical protein
MDGFEEEKEKRWLGVRVERMDQLPRPETVRTEVEGCCLMHGF